MYKRQPFDICDSLKTVNTIAAKYSSKNNLSRVGKFARSPKIIFELAKRVATMHENLTENLQKGFKNLKSQRNLASSEKLVLKISKTKYTKLVLEVPHSIQLALDDVSKDEKNIVDLENSFDQMISFRKAFLDALERSHTFNLFIGNYEHYSEFIQTLKALEKMKKP